MKKSVCNLIELMFFYTVYRDVLESRQVGKTFKFVIVSFARATMKHLNKYWRMWACASAITRHSLTGLLFHLLFLVFSILKSQKVRDHHQIPFLILRKFKRINLLFFPPEIFRKP